MLNADEPISDYQKAVRERAAASLGGVRHTFSSPVKSQYSEYSTAVARLKGLIGQYNQSKLGARKPAPLTGQNLVGDVFSVSRAEIPVENFPGYEDLTLLLDNQFAVVQHLEGQEEFYKDALSALKQRTELLIEENRTLYEQLKTQAASEILASDFEQGGTENVETPTETAEGPAAQGLPKQTKGTPDKGRKHHEWSVGDSRQESSLKLEGFGDSQVFLSPKERNFVVQLEDEVDKIRKLHQSKTRHLESLLYSTRDELEDYQRQVAELQGKLRDQEVLGEQHSGPRLCVKCAHQEAVLSTGYGDVAMKTMKKMTRDRDELMETLSRQKATLAEVRQRDLEAYMQVKKSCEMVEQSQLEKAEAIIQVHQLRDEIAGQQQRHEKLVASCQERIAVECEKVRAVSQKEVEEVLKKLESHAEARGAVENQLERVTREKISLASELEQAKAQIMAHSVDESKTTEEIRQELSNAMMKQTMASQEVVTLKAAAQQSAREREQERTRLTTEMSELKRRLREAEASWVEGKEECIRLTENWNQARREVKTAVVARQNSENARDEAVKNCKRQIEEKDQQLTEFIRQEQARKVEFKMEAENIWEAKKRVTHQVKDECQKLAKKLQETSEKSKVKVQEARKAGEMWRTKLRNMEAEMIQKEATIRELSTKLKRDDSCVKTYAKQVQQLLMKQSNLMRERQMLRLEVEYLRTRLGHAAPLDVVTTARVKSNANQGNANEQ